MPDDAMPDPLVPADADLKNYPYTPIYRARLFGSDFHAKANDAEWRAGLTLWLKSQDQAPAGSLPDDDVALCRLAELGRDLRTWRKLKTVALHGWFPCNDGRLYHLVVASVVIEQLQSKKARRDRTAAARAAKAEARLSQPLSQPLSQTPNGAIKASVAENVTTSVTGSNRREGKGIEGKGIEDTDAVASVERAFGAPRARPAANGHANGRDANERTARKSRIPADCEPGNEHFAYAAKLGHTVEWVESEFPKFRDHHLARGTLCADWFAAWRTWVQRAPDFARTPPPSGGRAQPGPIAAAVRAIQSRRAVD